MQKNNKKIAILYDCPYPFVYGGGQKRFYKIAQSLITQGWTIDWLCLKFWEGPDMITQDGINYIAVGKKVDLYRPDGKRSTYEALYYGFCIAKQFHLARYDILHAGQWPYFHLFPIWITQLFSRSTKFVIDWWEIWDKDWFNYAGKKGFIGLALEKIAYRLTNNIITISEQGKEQLISLRKPHPNITVIHNGIDYHSIQKVPKHTFQTDLTYLGRLKDHKNVDLLVKAIGLLKARGLTVTLQIIGDGPEKPKLEAMANNLGISSQLYFFGQIDSDDEVYSRMKASRLFVHPSTKEGGGSITTLEANACGLPVIAFTHPRGISKELINQGVNGYWVNEISAEALANTIQVALNDYNKHPELSTNTIQFVQQFDWELIGKRYHNYFCQLIEND